MGKEKQARSISILLASTGVLLLSLCVTTVIRRQDALAGGLAVLGLGAMVLAALTPRLTGSVEMSLTGFKMELVKLTEVGRLSQYSEEEILTAIEARIGAPKDLATASPPAVSADRRLALPLPPVRAPEIDNPSAVPSHEDADFVPQRKVEQDDARRLFESWLDEVDRTNLVEAVELAEKMLRKPVPEQKLGVLQYAAISLRGHVQRSESDEILEILILVQRAILSGTPKDSPYYPTEVERLASALKMRAYRNNDLFDHSEAVDLISELEDARRRGQHR